MRPVQEEDMSDEYEFVEEPIVLDSTAKDILTAVRALASNVGTVGNQLATVALYLNDINYTLKHMKVISGGGGEEEEDVTETTYETGGILTNEEATIDSDGILTISGAWLSLGEILCFPTAEEISSAEVSGGIYSAGDTAIDANGVISIPYSVVTNDILTVASAKKDPGTASVSSDGLVGYDSDMTIDSGGILAAGFDESEGILQKAE